MFFFMFVDDGNYDLIGGSGVNLRVVVFIDGNGGVGRASCGVR